MKISNFKQSHIRFTEKEYRKIIADAQTHRKTIPELLKAVYFRKKLRQPDMPPGDARRVHIELIRIGDNVNQIAKQLNSGFRQGFNPSVDEMREDMRAMRHFVLGMMAIVKIKFVQHMQRLVRYVMDGKGPRT